MLTGGTEPTYVLEGREALTPVFADLNRYDVTTHFNGQSTVATKTRAALTFFKGASLKDRRGCSTRASKAIPGAQSTSTRR